MTDDQSDIYSHDMHHWLTAWAQWARGNKLIRKPTHALARLIRQRIDDDFTPGHVDHSDFTLELEAIDKAIYRLRNEPQGNKVRRVIIKYYLRGQSHMEIATILRVPEYIVRRWHLLALNAMDRYARVIYDSLKTKQN